TARCASRRGGWLNWSRPNGSMSARIARADIALGPVRRFPGGLGFDRQTKYWTPRSRRRNLFDLLMVRSCARLLLAERRSTHMRGPEIKSHRFLSKTGGRRG